MKRPAFWILFGIVSVASAVVGIRYFPQAFSIVALDITMDREGALDAARAIMVREALGPAAFRQAASFGLDSEAQTFVELEGGGKEAFTRMMRDGLYSAYTWRVRHFKEGETNETTIRFTPDGRSYGFVEKLKEDAPGAALEGAAARRVAEAAAAGRWSIDLGTFALVEQGQERRTGGRIDHTLSYERASPTLNEGRYRLRLVVSGDRLTEVTHFLKIPEAFSRRYASMRSANDAIGIGSVVGLALLYVLGGIGVGLFFMLRKRFVVWRPAAAWGVVVALMQVLASANEFPLLWMTYDTAVPRTTFLVQQIASLAAIFVGFSVFFGLSFMAAETLTRRAFGSHPQFWRVWSKGPGSSKDVLGCTVAGYLLVSVFFAYDVMLYLMTTKTLGWWSPSEALLHPDVLATYVPWLSAIANSFQAGFWEEALFRAVPLAGAALIGDRFGKRGLFLVIGFVVQALIFGAGHAPYPNQPSYARPVELILPSIGFGLIYLYYGLLPGIILHFAFDVVWFALPIFLADAPGIWLQKLMVVVMTLVPVWIVLWRRVQAGRWTSLSPEDRNAAWIPPPPIERPETVAVHPHHTLDPRAGKIWAGLGAVGLVVCVIALAVRSDSGGISIGRQQAADIARRALDQRGVRLDARWRVMPVPENGANPVHEFISVTAGEQRRQQLLGVYLPAPRWRVRIATWQGDVADRAEEWLVIVTGSGEVKRVEHTLPQERPGASLDEAAARTLAQAALVRDARLDVTKGEAREVLARPSKQKARTDWTFDFVDTTVPALPKGEPRVDVQIAGDEVARVARFIHVPEDWQRQQRAADTRDLILRVLSGLVFGGLLVAAAVGGVIAWSRRQYTPRLFVVAAAVMFLVSLVNGVNGWPAVPALLPTEMPLPLALVGVIGIGLVALTITSMLVGLALGAQPQRLAGSGELPRAEALRLGIAAGLFGSALLVAVAWFKTPAWAQFPDVMPLGTVLPLIDSASDSVIGLLTRAAVILATLTAIDRLTSGWSHRRALAAFALAVIGFLGAGAPAGSHFGGWAIAGALTAAGLLGVYVTLLRFDLTMVPLALGVMTAVGALVRGAQGSFPGALGGAAVAVLVVAALSWWCFGALRKWRAHQLPVASG
jgi:CAAX prenyl protease-like protein